MYRRETGLAMALFGWSTTGQSSARKRMYVSCGLESFTLDVSYDTDNLSWQARGLIFFSSRRRGEDDGSVRGAASYR